MEFEKRGVEVTIRARTLILLALLAAAAAVWCRLQALKKRGAAGPNKITLHGNVDIREAELAFNISGRVKTMRVEEGDRVKKGQLLATLEPDLYAAEVKAAKARMAAREAELDRLQAGSRPEEIERARSNVARSGPSWKTRATCADREADG